MHIKPPHPFTLMVLAPKGPVEPLASRLPSGDSARQAGQVVSSCRPCIVRRHTQCWVFQACRSRAHNWHGLLANLRCGRRQP